MWKLRDEFNGVKIGFSQHRLIAIGKQFRFHSEKGIIAWAVVAQCSCGNFKLVLVGDLKRGSQKSCGCWKSDYGRIRGKSNTKHGQDGSPLYICWHNIKQRCNNPNQESFHHYGGRGITYCPEWEQFEPFMEWALANGYREGLQIDRRENDGNYTPENCRFVTPKINSRNRRNTITVVAWGETKTLAAWSEDSRCRISYSTLHGRITGKTKKQWNPEEAISTPSTPRSLRLKLS